MRSPRATGLASSLSGCIFVTGQRRLFRHRRRGGRLTGPAETSCPSRNRALPLFRLSASFIGRRFNETSARVTRPCWCAVTTVCPLGQLRFAQARNRLELLYSTHRGFSSRFAARSSVACGTCDRARRTGESCLLLRSRSPVFEGPNQPA